MAEGAGWRWGEPGDEACRMGGTGWYRQVTITEKEGGVERKTNLTLPSPPFLKGHRKRFRSYKHQSFSNLPPLPKEIYGLPQTACPHTEDPWWTSVMGCCACHGKMH